MKLALPRFASKRRVAMFLALFVSIAVLQYPQQLLGIESSIFSFMGATRHSFERVLLLLPVAYAGYFFGVEVGLASSAAALAVMLPRVFILSTAPADALLESIFVTAVGVVLIIWFRNDRTNVLKTKSIQDILAKIIDSSPIPIFAIDREHSVTQWNTAMESLSGINKPDMIGTDRQWKAFYLVKRPVMADLIVDEAPHAEIEKCYPGKLRRSPLVSGGYEAEDFFADLGDGGKWLRFTAAPITDSHGKVIGAMETLQDVTEQKNAEQSVGYYIREATRAQEEERKRIACELHDETAQELVALSRKLESLGPVKSEARLEEVQTQVNRILDGVRRFSQDLRPSVLDDLGLVPALKWLAADFSNHFSLPISMEVSGTLRRLPADVELVLFRITQEALRNVCKHSAASHAGVVLTFGDAKVNLLVKDDGKGFEMRKISHLSKNGKLGIAGMQQRAQLIGAHFTLQSEPGKGTVITIDAPAPPG